MSIIILQRVNLNGILKIRRVSMNWLIVLLMAAVPLIEQKGSIILGIHTYNINPVVVFLLTFVGSLLPVPFILICFNKIFDWLQATD